MVPDLHFFLSYLQASGLIFQIKPAGDEMKKTVFALVTSALAILGLASGAQARAISLSYTLNYWPPNPCVDTTLIGNIGVYDLTFDGPLIPEPGPPEVPCGQSRSGSFEFDAAPGTSLYLSFEGAIRLPDPGPPDSPVFAFAAGTNEGDDAVSGLPPSAPLLFIGSLSPDGILVPSPGPPDFPLFAFSSPGTEVGSISVGLAPVPEPSTLLLFGCGLAGAALLRSFTRR